MYKIKIIPVTEAQCKAGHYPKYTIQVREGNNHNSIKQTQELIEELNHCLQEECFGISGNEINQI